MGTRLIFLDRRQVRRGDGVLKIIRVLEVPVSERRKSTGKSVDEFPRRRIEVLRNRSDWMCFQEKPLSSSLAGPYRKPTLVGELNMLRRLRELRRRNSAN
jgi:hypothetical protein